MEGAKRCMGGRSREVELGGERVLDERTAEKGTLSSPLCPLFSSPNYTTSPCYMGLSVGDKRGGVNAAQTISSVQVSD